MMQLVDEPSPLADDGLQAAGDLTEAAHLIGQRRMATGRSVRAKRARRASMGSDFWRRNGGSVVLVALGINRTTA